MKIQGECLIPVTHVSKMTSFSSNLNMLCWFDVPNSTKFLMNRPHSKVVISLTVMTVLDTLNCC